MPTYRFNPVTKERDIADVKATTVVGRTQVGTTTRHMSAGDVMNQEADLILSRIKSDKDPASLFIERERVPGDTYITIWWTLKRRS